MGKITTTKNANGGLLFEITYGGVDSPFGGIDTSAPPAYIDPKCFVDADGFLIVNNKLIAASIVQVQNPTLWNGIEGITLLAIGTFFNAYTTTQIQQFNYALGYKFTNFGTEGISATGKNYTFYMTVWNPSNPTDAGTTFTDVLEYSLFDASVAATAASISLGVVGTNNITTNYTIRLVINGPAGGPNTYSVPSTSLSAQTPAAAVAAMVAAISSDPNVTASASLDGLSVVLTANTPGGGGNSITVQDTSGGLGGITAPGFYFTPRVAVNLEGGANLSGDPAPTIIGPASIANVGGVLYIANIGPLILNYAGPNTLQVSTVYNGFTVITKFAGALVGLGIYPQLGTVTQAKDMIFAWSASENLNEWAPVNAAGLVTGAGFEQLADIGDALTGLIVSNNTAFILRQQGVSYATPTGNGTEPYTVAHISLGNRGEGAQIPVLICQYDQLGMYISGTNVVSVTQQITPMGDKIKDAIFAFLNALPDPIPPVSTQPMAQAPYVMSSAACAVEIGGTEAVLYAFLLGQNIYIVNATNQTWMKMSYTLPASPLFLTQALLGVLSNSGLTSYAGTTTPNTGFSQSLLSMSEGLYNENSAEFVTPELYSLIEGVDLDTIISNREPFILFPVEEIMFGRSITFDALYIALQAQIPSDYITLTFQIYGQTLVNGQTVSELVAEQTLTIEAANFSNIDANPTEFQIFSSLGSFSVNSPQLKITASLPTPGVGSISGPRLLRFTKISEFGSFDPNQRPV
jgi:hypothetical protein